MDITQANEIMTALANGIDPTSGELFPADSPYNKPEIIRALYCALHFIDASRKKQKKTPEQRQADNIARGLPKNAGLPWPDELRAALAKDYSESVTVEQLADRYERTRGSIISELKRQGLITDEQFRASYRSN